MDTYKILSVDDITKICEETYNLLKDYCLTKNLYALDYWTCAIWKNYQLFGRLLV